MKKITCDNCKKCGENICGNDTEHLSCFEPLKLTKKETIRTIKRHLKGIEKALVEFENN